MIHAGMFTAARDDWETPQELFNSLDAEFGFTLDVCALPHNAKCKDYYTPESDGLMQEWSGVCWMNPPYGKQIALWVEKARQSSCTVVALLPARTDAGWFHNHINGVAEVRFIRGRVRFSGRKINAPFPSMVVVWRNSYRR